MQSKLGWEGSEICNALQYKSIQKCRIAFKSTVQSIRSLPSAKNSGKKLARNIRKKLSLRRKTDTNLRISGGYVGGLLSDVAGVVVVALDDGLVVRVSDRAGGRPGRGFPRYHRSSSWKIQSENFWTIVNSILRSSDPQGPG